MLGKCCRKYFSWSTYFKRKYTDTSCHSASYFSGALLNLLGEFAIFVPPYNKLLRLLAGLPNGTAFSMGQMAPLVEEVPSSLKQKELL